MNNTQYRQLIENLFLSIIDTFGSVEQCSKELKISKHNLSRIRNFKQDISVSLFMYLTESIDSKVLPPESNKVKLLPPIYIKLTIQDYLQLNTHLINNQIMKTILS